jgi:hypothetical protein
VIQPPDEYGIDDVRGALRAEGLHPHVLEPMLFLSVPESAEVHVDNLRVEARPATFARATGDRAAEGPLRPADPDLGESLSGAIAVVDGALTPDAAYSAERRGAVAQIYISENASVRPRSCSTIWGAPTHETLSRKPRTPIVMVERADGETLRQRARHGATARVFARLREGWMRAPVLVVEVRGAHDPEEFVLVHGSDDRALLALAAACHARQGELTRSVRVAWWPDRALGSAAGSSWYADAFAAELDRWCAAHVSVGGDAGADAYWMAEAAELCLQSMAGSGLEPAKSRRPPREADYSFNQIGITGLFGGHAFPPSVYEDAVVHVAKAAIYPFDYTAPLLEMGAAVQRYQAAAGNQIDFSGVSQDLARLRRAISAWRSEADQHVRRHEFDTTWRRHANATLRGLARVLVPLGFARGERFDHDPAVRYSALPRFEAALHVASADEPRRSFVRTALVRECNKVQARIRDALALVT